MTSPIAPIGQPPDRDDAGHERPGRRVTSVATRQRLLDGRFSNAHDNHDFSVSQQNDTQALSPGFVRDVRPGRFLRGGPCASSPPSHRGLAVGMNLAVIRDRSALCQEDRMMRCTKLVALALLAAPTVVPAYQTTEDIVWPNTGRYPAYPAPEPDERIVEPFVSGGVTWDSNLFRLSDAADTQATLGSTQKSDTRYRLGAGIRANLAASRQRVILEGRVDDDNFERFAFLNHTGYKASATWKWLAGPNGRGDLGYSRRRFLASLAELQAPLRDIITEDRAFGAATYLLTPRWRLRGGMEWLKFHHSEPIRASLDSRTVSTTLGVDYLTPAGGTAGTQVKYSNGEFPQRQFVAGSLVDNRYDEVEASAVVSGYPGGKSHFDMRIGYTSRRHGQLSQRDFDGMTGRLDFDWTPTAKILLNAAVWREIRSIEDVSASYVLSQGFSLGPRWAPTSKLVFQARWVYEKRDFEGDPGFILAGGPAREDRFRGGSLAVGYTPWRNAELALAYERGDRNSNVLGRDYDYDAVSANVKVAF